MGIAAWGVLCVFLAIITDICNSIDDEVDLNTRRESEYD